MLKCQDVQSQFQAFLDNELDESQSGRINDHLKDCPSCSDALRRLTKLFDVLQSWQGPEPPPLLYERLKVRLKAQCSHRGGISARPWVRKVAFHLTEVAAVVALTLSVNHWLKKTPPIPDESATLNFYLREHQDVAAQVASFEPSPPPEARMEVPQHDILYYEFMGEPYEFGRPGIIVRGPSSERQAAPAVTPAIANGHSLTLAEAKKAANFNLVSPPRLHPGYMLDQIRRIDGRDALHLLYTNGIDTVSLFEQPLDGVRGLVPDDFREYAVYCNKGLAGGTILAWRDRSVSYVLVGKAEMSRLMDMAQSISAAK